MKISTRLIKGRASSTNCTMGNLATQHTYIQSMLNLPRFISFLLYKSLNTVNIYSKLKLSVARLEKTSNLCEMTSASSGARNVYPLVAPEFTLAFI